MNNGADSGCQKDLTLEQLSLTTFSGEVLLINRRILTCLSKWLVKGC